MTSEPGHRPHRRQDELQRHGLTEAPPWASANAPAAYRAGAGFYRQRDVGVGASLLSGATFLAGIWLIIAPFALGNGTTIDLVVSGWTEIVIGVVLAALALARSVAPRRASELSLVNVVLGIWLIVKAFVPDVSPAIESGAYMVNDVIVGGIVVLVAAGSAGLTWHARNRVSRTSVSHGEENGDA